MEFSPLESLDAVRAADAEARAVARQILAA